MVVFPAPDTPVSKMTTISSSGAKLLLHILRPGGRVPRIVTKREANSLRNRGMAIRPEDEHTVGGGVVITFFAQFLEGRGCDFPVVGKQAVRYLEAVNIGLMFNVAAEGGADGVAGKRKKRKRQHQHGQGCQIIEAADVPLPAPQREHHENDAAPQP